MSSIRSFVRREGRLTAGQQRALEEFWPRFGISHSSRLSDFGALFGRHAPRFLEIGCGDGICLAALAGQYPDCDFLGIDVYRPGLGRVLQRLAHRSIANVRLIAADVVDVLPDITAASIDGVYIFFPDPWPKKRHHKRRLIQDTFIDGLRNTMVDGARLYIATDWQDYALQIEQVCTRSAGLLNLAGSGEYAPRLHDRPPTRYEERALRAGRRIFDLVYAAV